MSKYIYETSDFDIKIMENKLEGFEIKNLKLSYKANEHTKLELEFENFKEARNYEGYLNEKKPEIQILLTKDGNSLNFFTGKIEEINIGSYGVDGHTVALEAYSCTKELDREKKFRVYQDINTTIGTILEEIKGEYKDVSMVINEKVKNVKIGKPIVQYDETDWEFMKRVASHAGVAIYPKAVNAFIVGPSVGNHQEKSISTNQNYWSKTKNIYDEYKYRLHSNSVAICGDEVHLQIGEGQRIELVAAEGEIWLEEGITNSKIELLEERYKYEYIPNKKIAGKVIEGTVVEVVADGGIAKMRLNLTAGLEKSAGVIYGEKAPKKKAYKDKQSVFKYPFVTPYSQSNTGLFCTPEKGDRVAVYYPTEEEIESYVMGSVNSNGNDRFCNPDFRNYTLPIEKNGEEYFNFQLKKDTLNIFTGKDISLSANKSIEVFSEVSTSVVSNGDLNAQIKESTNFATDCFSKKVSDESSLVINRTLNVENSREIFKNQAKNIIKYLVNNK